MNLGGENMAYLMVVWKHFSRKDQERRGRGTYRGKGTWSIALQKEKKGKKKKENDPLESLMRKRASQAFSRVKGRKKKNGKLSARGGVKKGSPDSRSLRCGTVPPKEGGKSRSPPEFRAKVFCGEQRGNSWSRSLGKKVQGTVELFHRRQTKD